MYPKVILVVLALLVSVTIYAQQAESSQTVEMADAMRANGMIYVVVAVVAVVMAGILAYVIATDRKISRI